MIDVYEQLNPISFKQANSHSTGRKIDPLYRDLSVGDKVCGMPYFFDGRLLVSIWKCNSLRARVRFLITGKINVVEFGHLRPRALIIGNPFDAKNRFEE